MNRVFFVLLLASSLAFALPEQLPHPDGYPGGWSDLVHRSALVEYELVDRHDTVFDRGQIHARVVDSNSAIIPKAFTFLTILRGGILLWEGNPTTTQVAAVTALGLISCASWLVLGYQRVFVQPAAPLFLLSDTEHPPVSEKTSPVPLYPSHILSLRDDIAHLLQRIVSRGAAYVGDEELSQVERVRIVLARSYHNHLAELITVPRDIVIIGKWNRFQKIQSRSLRELLRTKTLHPSGKDLSQMDPELAERFRRDP